MSMLVCLLTQQARLPEKGSDDAAGWDLYASETITIEPGKTGLIPLGISVSIPKGHYGRIADRSSIAIKNVITAAGVIDADYRGEVKVVMMNHNHEPFTIVAGQRCAQMIIEFLPPIGIQRAQILEETCRGVGGFGSTGSGSLSNQ